MEHTPKRTTGHKCVSCHNNIGVDSNQYIDGDKRHHLHCVHPSKRK